MKDRLVKRVLSRDPRENRKKSPAEIRRRWLERRAYALIFTVPGFAGAIYFIRWAGMQLSDGEAIPLRASLPTDASWALGLAVFGFLGWAVWGTWGYSCPHCARFVGMDWSFGLSVFEPKDSPQFDCPHCRSRLS